MRHGKKVNHLSRTKSHRDALLANLAISLIKAKRIETTLAKAKALRMYVEPLITKSKDDSTHSRRTVFSYLQDKEAIKILFSDIAEKVAERNGGYTRIIKLGQRQGDNAVVAMIELVDFNDNLVADVVSQEEASAKRSRRGKSKKVESAATPSPKVAPIVDESSAEVVEELVTAEVITTTVEETVELSTPIVDETAVEVTAVTEDLAPVIEVETPIVEEVASISEVQESVTSDISSSTDDLKLIEGIGPKIADLLIADGIDTFYKLANTSAEDISVILEKGGSNFASHNPATWPEQSLLAAEGKMDELKELQDRLIGGKPE